MTKAERRILNNLLRGDDPFRGGGNGPTRACIKRMNAKGWLKGHLLTRAGLDALKERT